MTKFPIPDAAIAQHTIALGKTRAGKSSKLRVIVEGLLDAAKPVCLIDPKGDWWGLKSSADGKKAGYPVVIFGGEHADVPINEHSGAAVAELIASGNRPCILDLGGWMIAPRTRFFIEFASTLFKLTRGQRWLAIDECHNFAPKGKLFDPDAAKMLHWANRLASEGAGKGLVLLSASQRPQKVHNDYLTSHETLIACRVIHKADRDALKDWIDGCADPTIGKEMLAALANMERANAYVWSPEIKFGPALIHWPMFRAYDSFKPQDVHGPVTLQGWASVDLEDVKAKLATAVEEAKSNDPKALKAEIARLSSELRQKNADKPLSNEQVRHFDETMKRAHENGRQEGYRDGFQDGRRRGVLEARIAFYGEYAQTFQNGCALYERELAALDQKQLPIPAKNIFQNIPAPPPAFPPPLESVSRREPSQRKAIPQNGLDRAAIKLLEAFRRYPDGLTWEEACIIAGMIPGNGYFYGGKKRLVEGGYVVDNGGRYVASDATSRPLTRSEIVVTWSKLKQPAPRMLDALFRRSEMSVDELANAIGAKPGNGYWYGGVAALRDANLIDDRKSSIALSAFVREAS